eukprot:gene13355-15782_t
MSEKKPGWLKVAQKATGKDLAQLTVASLLEKQLFGVVDSAVGLASKSMKDSRAGSVQLVKCEKEMKEDRARMQNAEVRAQSAEDKVKNLELKVKALESKNRVLQEQRKDEKEQMQSDIDRLNAQLERFEKEVILALRSGVADTFEAWFDNDEWEAHDYLANEYLDDETPLPDCEVARYHWQPLEKLVVLAKRKEFGKLYEISEIVWSQWAGTAL